MTSIVFCLEIMQSKEMHQLLYFGLGEGWYWRASSWTNFWNLQIMTFILQLWRNIRWNSHDPNKPHSAPTKFSWTFVRVLIEKKGCDSIARNVPLWPKSWTWPWLLGVGYHLLTGGPSAVASPKRCLAGWKSQQEGTFIHLKSPSNLPWRNQTNKTLTIYQYIHAVALPWLR